MIARIRQLPLFLILLGTSAVAMLVPAGYGASVGEFHVARSFFYSAILLVFVVWLVAVAMSRPRHSAKTNDHLFALIVSFAVLPAVFALPFHEGGRLVSFMDAYFEMVSCMTTTGTTAYELPGSLSPALHLWRGLVGWLGGLLMWISAGALFAPLNLGGYEVTSRRAPGHEDASDVQFAQANPMRRWERSTVALVPVYAGLTLALWIMLLFLGDSGLQALMHAMATMSTSGITFPGGIESAPSGLAGEAVILLFLLFALSRLTFSMDTTTGERHLLADPEFRLGLLIIASVTLFIMARHWLGAFDERGEAEITSGLRAAWGALFTTVSFLTTTGFVSAEWDVAARWSYLETPGMLLMGLAIMGGGVATTAGGVKLLRVFVLYLQGLNEIRKLVHPSIVQGEFRNSRRVSRRGTEIAWVFFMLFALSLGAVAITLSAFGLDFERAVVLSVASLTTTGPIVNAIGSGPLIVSPLAGEVKLVLSAAMILGRLETLAIIALLSPDLWRR